MGKKKRGSKRGLKGGSTPSKAPLNRFPAECPECGEDTVAIRDVRFWQCFKCGHLWHKKGEAK